MKKSEVSNDVPKCSSHYSRNTVQLYATARGLQEELVKLKSDFAAFASSRSSELGELNLRLLDKEQELNLLKTAADEEGSEADDDMGDTTLVDAPEFVCPHSLRPNAEDV